MAGLLQRSEVRLKLYMVEVDVGSMVVRVDGLAGYRQRCDVRRGWATERVVVNI